MATVDEEILLHVPEETASFDALTALDEDILLGAGDVSRKTTDELAEHNDPKEEEEKDKVEEEKEEKEDEEEEVESEKEELDYDEEEENDEKRERTSRYASEKSRGARCSEEGGDDENKEHKPKKPSGIPSLFDKTITNNPLSSDQPIGVRLRIEGEQERIFYPPPSFMTPEATPLHIVPRLPNGIPLLGMPANHGRAGFGVSYKDQPRMAGGGGVAGWDEAVSMFLSGSRSSRKSRRRSSSSSSSSYSSGRSRSSSRTRRHRKEPRRERERYKDRRPRYQDNREKEKEKERERENRRKKEKTASFESARALGLSNEYMEKINEQKKKREEIVKKKEERRQAPPPGASGNLENAPKMKAFLAVNVCGVEQLPTAVKRIEAMAVDLGPIKKCWRSATDTVSIIFNAHDKAKDFMIKFNGKILSGLRITVSLEKKFLNLNEVN